MLFDAKLIEVKGQTHPQKAFIKFIRKRRYQKIIEGGQKNYLR